MDKKLLIVCMDCRLGEEANQADLTIRNGGGTTFGMVGAIMKAVDDGFSEIDITIHKNVCGAKDAVARSRRGEVRFSESINRAFVMPVEKESFTNNDQLEDLSPRVEIENMRKAFLAKNAKVSDGVEGFVATMEDGREIKVGARTYVPKVEKPGHPHYLVVMDSPQKGAYDTIFKNLALEKNGGEEKVELGHSYIVQWPFDKDEDTQKGRLNTTEGGSIELGVQALKLTDVLFVCWDRGKEDKLKEVMELVKKSLGESEGVGKMLQKEGKELNIAFLYAKTNERIRQKA